ncbi:MAG: PD-(D/E)XK nuclease family protein [Cytophagaceae bacterium]
MKKFLQILAEETWTSDGHRYCYVFPSKRAGLYFKEHLKKYIKACGGKEVVMLPAILTFSEFVKNNSSLLSSDKLDLILRMYQIYKKLLTEEGKAASVMDFDKFYPLGVTLLNDFNEIDFSLIETDRLFRDLLLLKEYEHAGMEGLLEYEAVQQFIASFRSYKNELVKEQFLWLWKLTGRIYTEFKKTLLEEGMGYDGLIYRNAAEVQSADSLIYTKVVFAGFNALKKAEASIIENLLTRQQAEIFWDADNYYIKDQNQEAGYYIRTFSKKWEHLKSRVLFSELVTSLQQIHTFGVALQIGQVKALHDVLSENLEVNFKAEETVVVIPDQNMLQPLLYSLPHTLSDINVTMGLSVRRSHIFSLLEYVYQAFREARLGEEGLLINNQHILYIFNHPLIHPLSPKGLASVNKKLQEQNLLWISKQSLEENPALDDKVKILTSLLFEGMCKGGQDFLHLLDKIIDTVLSAGGLSTSDLETCYFAKRSIYKILDTSFLHKEMSFSMHTAWKLIREVFTSSTVPLEGAGTDGLQLMGPMETRCLDFKNVLILTANEGIYPAKSTFESIIPYQIRKAYGMPVYEDHDANYAYQFYNLIQRAQNLYCFYNTEASGVGKGEISRYILQLKNELANAGSKAEFKDHVVTFSLGDEADSGEIAIKKSPEIIDLLKRYTVSSGQSYYLSPSALSTYLNCPLQFYFTYLAGIKEKEEAGEDLEAWAMGNIVHRTMELLYEEHVNENKIVTQSDVEKLQKRVGFVMEKVLEEEQISKYRREGFNDLLLAALKKYIENILTNDLKEAPFKVLASEEKLRFEFPAGGEVFVVGGKIDQVREKGGEVYLIDFKTGKSQKEPVRLLSDFENYIEQIFSNQKEYRYIFQMAMYGYLYKVVKQISNPNLQLHFLRENVVNQLQYPAGMDASLFGDRLSQVLEELNDGKTAFCQTNDEKSCLYCSFKSLCRR